MAITPKNNDPKEPKLSDFVTNPPIHFWTLKNALKYEFPVVLLSILKDNKTYPEELVGLRGGSGLKNTFFSASNTYTQKDKVKISQKNKTETDMNWPELRQQRLCR